MSKTDNSLYVTCREFYSALMIVWLYILLVIGDLMRLEGRSGTRFLLWAASFFMTAVYIFLSIRSRPTSSAKIE